MKTPPQSCWRPFAKLTCPRHVKRGRTLTLLLGFLWLPVFAPAQEGPATLVGELSDGTPAPPGSKPELPKVEIRETLEHQLPDRKITVNRIKDPGLPDPRPEPPKITERSQEEIDAFRNSPEFQRWREKAAKTTHLFISATVVDHRATLLRWWRGGAEYRAWSHANWLYLTGFADCQKGDRHFSTMLMPRNIDSARLPADSPLRIPENWPSEPGTYQVIQGDLTNKEAFEGITALHELYQSDYARLKAAYELREQRRKERATAPRANPPKPEDIVLHYWKVEPEKEAPARPKGGAR